MARSKRDYLFILNPWPGTPTSVGRIVNTTVLPDESGVPIWRVEKFGAHSAGQDAAALRQAGTPAATTLPIALASGFTKAHDGNMKLHQGQVWQQGEQRIRIVTLERLSVKYKVITNLETKEGTHHQVTKKEFCRLIKNAVLLPPDARPAPSAPVAVADPVSEAVTVAEQPDCIPASLT